MNQNPIGNPSTAVRKLTQQTETTPIVPVPDQTFTEAQIVLDGSRWVNCRFVRCRVAVVLGAFRTEGCDFEDCEIAFAGAAGRVFDLCSNNLGSTRRA